MVALSSYFVLFLSTVLLAHGATAQQNFLTSDLSAQEYLQTTTPNVVLSAEFPTPELHSAWEHWKNAFNRVYESTGEGALRKLTWLQNHAHITNHNSMASSFTLGHNDFSDLSNDEFKQKYHLGEHSPGIFMPKGRDSGKLISSERKLRKENYVHISEHGDEVDTSTVDDVPAEKNWVEEGAVTNVKNQWFCGACWAFSAVGAIEGARFIQTGNLTDLSIQQLIDCDLTDMGCGGGLMSYAFQYDEDDTGLCALEDYPFAMHRHWFYGCKRYMAYCEPLKHTKVAKYVNVTATEEALTAAIATQPVSVAVTAGGVNWQFYSSGVMAESCEDEVDHGVLAVGYGHYDPRNEPEFVVGTDSTQSAMDYYMVKNSWGSWWGIDGYIRLGRNIGHVNGSSCILTLASRPILKAED
ncbi:hypothetical protein ACHAXN_009269 [Cyclotella atomus]